LRQPHQDIRILSVPRGENVIITIMQRGAERRLQENWSMRGPLCLLDLLLSPKPLVLRPEEDFSYRPSAINTYRPSPPTLQCREEDYGFFKGISFVDEHCNT